LQEIDPVGDISVVAPAGALSSYYWSNPSQPAVSHQRRRGASESVTAVKSYYENAEDCPYFLIQPDRVAPSAPRSWSGGPPPQDLHHQRGGDKALGLRVEGRHLHLRDVRDAHHKIRVERERKERERKELWHPVA